MNIAEVQRRAWQNKLAKGFSTGDVPLEFGLLTAEVSEAFTAWRRRQADLVLVARSDYLAIGLHGQRETGEQLVAPDQRSAPQIGDNAV